MNYAAVSHHAYGTFCYPINKNNLKITIQTGKDIKSLVLIWGDPFLSEKIEGKWKWKSLQEDSFVRKETQNHFLWTIIVSPPFKRCRYYFKISDGIEDKYFFEDGFFAVNEKTPENHVQFIFPWMNEIDICTVPSWAQQTIWYQIFPARFAHGKNPADKNPLLPWASPTQKVKNEERYGGNLRGIIEHLDYLEKLGINGLYLNPVNLAKSQHKYDTTDYFTIDGEFGTREDMIELVQKAHVRGMRVMLDGVFNHTGWDFFAWQDVVKNREKSPYASWYIVNDFDFAEYPSDAAKNGKFYSFAFTDHMPKLNTSNPDVRKYIVNVCERWVKEYDIDAIRLDVANEISHELCRELHNSLRALKSDFFIVGEIWNHALPWLTGDQFDSVINYPLRTAIMDFAEDKSQTAHELEMQLNLCFFMYMEQNERVLLNQLDSHDTPRLVTKCKNRDLALQQFALLFMLTGSICLYYGTEVLLEGEHDPDCRRCMPWNEIEAGKYKTELAIFSSLIALRKKFKAFSELDFCFVSQQNSQIPDNSRIIQLYKSEPKSNERFLFTANFSEKDFRLNSTPILLLSHKLQNLNLRPGGFAIQKC